MELLLLDDLLHAGGEGLVRLVHLPQVEDRFQMLLVMYFLYLLPSRCVSLRFALLMKLSGSEQLLLVVLSWLK